MMKMRNVTIVLSLLTVAALLTTACLKPKSKILIENIEEPLLIYIPKCDCKCEEKVPENSIEETKPIEETEYLYYTKTSKCQIPCENDLGTFNSGTYPVYSNLYIPSSELPAIDIRDANMQLNDNINYHRNKYGRNGYSVYC